MPTYCVNTKEQSDSGDHEVHDTSSSRWCHPDPANQLSLGYHDGCASAVQDARRYYSQVNGCAFCAPTCHTT
jgi:hypothetical protein